MLFCYAGVAVYAVYTGDAVSWRRRRRLVRAQSNMAPAANRFISVAAARAVCVRRLECGRGRRSIMTHGD